MSDTELTVSHQIVVTVAVEGLDFNGVVAAIRRATAQACGELLGRPLRAAFGQAAGTVSGRAALGGVLGAAVVRDRAAIARRSESGGVLRAWSSQAYVGRRGG